MAGEPYANLHIPGTHDGHFGATIAPWDITCTAPSATEDLCRTRVVLTAIPWYGDFNADAGLSQLPAGRVLGEFTYVYRSGSGPPAPGEFCLVGGTSQATATHLLVADECLASIPIFTTEPQGAGDVSFVFLNLFHGYRNTQFYVFKQTSTTRDPEADPSIILPTPGDEPAPTDETTYVDCPTSGMGVGIPTANPLADGDYCTIQILLLPEGPSSGWDDEAPGVSLHEWTGYTQGDMTDDDTKPGDVETIWTMPVVMYDRYLVLGAGFAMRADFEAYGDGYITFFAGTGAPYTDQTDPRIGFPFGKQTAWFDLNTYVCEQMWTDWPGADVAAGQLVGFQVAAKQFGPFVAIRIYAGARVQMKMFQRYPGRAPPLLEPYQKCSAIWQPPTSGQGGLLIVMLTTDSCGKIYTGFGEMTAAATAAGCPIVFTAVGGSLIEGVPTHTEIVEGYGELPVLASCELWGDVCASPTIKIPDRHDVAIMPSLPP